MTEQDTTEATAAEPQAGSATITDVAQLQQLLRQAEVDRAYWQGRAEAVEKELRLAQGVQPVVNNTAAPAVATPAAPAAQPGPGVSFSPEKIVPVLLQLISSNPDILKMIVPLLAQLGKAANAPRNVDG